MSFFLAESWVRGFCTSSESWQIQASAPPLRCKTSTSHSGEELQKNGASTWFGEKGLIPKINSENCLCARMTSFSAVLQHRKIFYFSFICSKCPHSWLDRNLRIGWNGNITGCPNKISLCDERKNRWRIFNSSGLEWVQLSTKIPSWSNGRSSSNQFAQELPYKQISKQQISLFCFRFFDFFDWKSLVGVSGLRPEKLFNAAIESELKRSHPSAKKSKH